MLNFEEMRYNLLNAVKFTAEKYGYNVYAYLVNSLKEIIIKNSYNSITRDQDYRSKIAKYSGGNYFTFMVASLRSDPNTKNLELINKVNLGYSLTDQEIGLLIESFCTSQLFHQLDSLTVSPNSNVLVEQPQNIKFYNPSEELKKQIIEGKQTILKKSSYKFNDMYAYSSVGKKRNNQEDSYYIGIHPSNPDFKLLAVADGMGGMASGEIASNIAIKELMMWFDSLPPSIFYETDNRILDAALEKAIAGISSKIYNMLGGRGGTTLCVSIIKNDCIIMANVGDSQGYVIENDKLKHATSPDSIVSTLLESNGIPKEFARFHYRASQINNCLGQKDAPGVSISEVELKKRKTYKIILCSDGVTDCISEKRIMQIASNSENASQALVEYAIENDSYLSYEMESLSRKDKLALESSIQAFNNYIAGGKDNTTAVSATIKKH